MENNIRRIIAFYKRISIEKKAAMWALFAGVIQKGIGVLSTPIFTRILTTEQYAQYTLYQSWHDIFIIFTSLNVYYYATYTAMAKYDRDKEGFIASAQSLVTLLTIFGFAVYSIIHMFCGPVTGFPIGIMALMFADMLFVVSYNLWIAKERYEFHYKMMTITSIIIGIAGPFLGVAAVYLVDNPGYGRIYGVAFVNIAIGIWFYLYNIRQSKKLIQLKYWKYILGFCLPLIPHFLSTQILTRFDRIMIEKMCGYSDVGIYSLAYSLATLMSLVSDAIMKTYTPWTYQQISSGSKDNSIAKTTNYILILIAIVNLVLILFAPEAVKIFAPVEYYDAIYVIPSIAASMYYVFLFSVFANIEYYFSETKYVAYASIGAALVNVILNYVFIRKFGYIAAGYTTLISYMLYSGGHYFFMRIVCKKHVKGINYYNNRVILMISLIFTVIALIIIPLYQFVLIRYCLILTAVSICILNRNKIYLILKKGEKKND